MDDITCRAEKVLAEVEIIASEDTRRTNILLGHLGVRPRLLLALHDHNEAQMLGRLIADLKAGRDVALVSDAGLPLIADPGFQLVRECWAQGIPVRPAPGASALTTLLSVCPIPANRVQFIGFLPAKAGVRKRVLEAACQAAAATLFLEAPHRIQETLATIAGLAPQRRLFLGREMTKQFESYHCGCAGQVLEALEAANALRGEFTCLLESAPNAAVSQPLEPGRLLAALVQELPPTAAARVMAQIFGGNKADHYRQAAALSRQHPG